MTPIDMQAWTAVRMIGEAASRAGGVTPQAIMAYMKGPDFAVAAYKGQKLTLRSWDWQLRQPILLSDGRSVVSVSPQPGFLHQVTETGHARHRPPGEHMLVQVATGARRAAVAAR